MAVAHVSLAVRFVFGVAVPAQGQCIFSFCDMNRTTEKHSRGDAFYHSSCVRNITFSSLEHRWQHPRRGWMLKVLAILSWISTTSWMNVFCEILNCCCTLVRWSKPGMVVINWYLLKTAFWIVSRAERKMLAGWGAQCSASRDGWCDEYVYSAVVFMLCADGAVLFGRKTEPNKWRHVG